MYLLIVAKVKQLMFYKLTELFILVILKFKQQSFPIINAGPSNQTTGTEDILSICHYATRPWTVCAMLPI